MLKTLKPLGFCVLHNIHNQILINACVILRYAMFVAPFVYGKRSIHSHHVFFLFFGNKIANGKEKISFEWETWQQSHAKFEFCEFYEIYLFASIWAFHILFLEKYGFPFHNNNNFHCVVITLSEVSNESGWSSWLSLKLASSSRQHSKIMVS